MIKKSKFTREKFGKARRTSSTNYFQAGSRKFNEGI